MLITAGCVIFSLKDLGRVSSNDNDHVYSRLIWHGYSEL